MSKYDGHHLRDYYSVVYITEYVLRKSVNHFYTLNLRDVDSLLLADLHIWTLADYSFLGAIAG
jgi:hypothetical protein